MCTLVTREEQLCSHIKHRIWFCYGIIYMQKGKFYKSPPQHCVELGRIIICPDKNYLEQSLRVWKCLHDHILQPITRIYSASGDAMIHHFTGLQENYILICLAMETIVSDGTNVLTHNPSSAETLFHGKACGCQI